jgi:hypothetical protein
MEPNKDSNRAGGVGTYARPREEGRKMKKRPYARVLAAALAGLFAAMNRPRQPPRLDLRRPIPPSC